MAPLERDRPVVALMRPQMFAGVTYSLFVINVVIPTELILIFKSFCMVAIACACMGLAC